MRTINASDFKKQCLNLLDDLDPDCLPGIPLTLHAGLLFSRASGAGG